MHVCQPKVSSEYMQHCQKTVMDKLLEIFDVQILQTALGYWQIMENGQYHRRAT
jgi:hypothetical protein